MPETDSKIRVLLFSDNPAPALLFARLFHLQHDIELVGTCNQLNQLQDDVFTQQPAVLLILWSVGSDPAILKEIRQRHPKLYIMCLGYESRIEVARILSEAASILMPQPFIPDEILSTIRQQPNQRQMDTDHD